MIFLLDYSVAINMEEVSAMDSADAKALATDWVGVGKELSVVLCSGYYTSEGGAGARGILQSIGSNGLTVKTDKGSVYMEYKFIAGIYNRKEIDKASASTAGLGIFL
jgi:hypothetical protein